MTTSIEQEFVPEWDLADRLAKALRYAQVSHAEMALYLGVHRNSVSAWVNGRTPISGPAIRAWAIRTGVDFDWLNTGTASFSPPPSPRDGQPEPLPLIDERYLLLPRLDSNQEPADVHPQMDELPACA